MAENIMVSVNLQCPTQQAAENALSRIESYLSSRQRIQAIGWQIIDRSDQGSGFWITGVLEFNQISERDLVWVDLQTQWGNGQLRNLVQPGSYLIRQFADGSTEQVVKPTPQ